MNKATYDDAVIIARILDMRVETVWAVIKGMKYAYYSDLKVAVLNSPSHPGGRRQPGRLETRQGANFPSR